MGVLVLAAGVLLVLAAAVALALAVRLPLEVDENGAGFMSKLGRRGGVVEERVVGTEVRSPSVQLRV